MRTILRNCDLAIRKEVRRPTWSILKTQDLEATYYFSPKTSCLCAFVPLLRVNIIVFAVMVALVSWRSLPAALPFPLVTKFISQAFIKLVLSIMLFFGNQIYFYYFKFPLS